MESLVDVWLDASCSFEPFERAGEFRGAFVTACQVELGNEVVWDEQQTLLVALDRCCYLVVASHHDTFRQPELGILHRFDLLSLDVPWHVLHFVVVALPDVLTKRQTVDQVDGGNQMAVNLVVELRVFLITLVLNHLDDVELLLVLKQLVFKVH